MATSNFIQPANKTPDWDKARWRKATASADGACVEVARAGDLVGVRDTKENGSGPVLTFNLREWDAFLNGACAGEFSPEVLD